MKHALIEKSTLEQIALADAAADWMLDAIACGSQDRRYLRGDPEYDEEFGKFLMANGKLAALRALHGMTS